MVGIRGLTLLLGRRRTRHKRLIMHMNVTHNEFLPYIFLSLALLLLWLRGQQNTFLRHAWLMALAIATLIALVQHLIEPIASVVMLLVAGLALSANNRHLHKTWRLLAGIAFIISVLALGLHLMPGFHSLPVIQDTALTPDATPYSLYLNFDKTLIGLFILGLWYQRPAKPQSWTATGITLAWILPLIIASVIILSALFNYIRFEPKLIDHLWLWIWANLFLTCTAEEAFFRGLIQHLLANLLANKPGGEWFAVSSAAILFGLAHLGGGWTYVLLAIVAGLGYGILYKQTGRIEASIAGHFGLNLVHILLFTYPALAMNP